LTNKIVPKLSKRCFIFLETSNSLRKILSENFSMSKDMIIYVELAIPPGYVVT
jgi:hypothetical protein